MRYVFRTMGTCFVQFYLHHLQKQSIIFSTIVLQKEESFHIFQLLEGKWFCDTCDTLCHLKNIIVNIITRHQDELVSKSISKTTHESMISSNPIPFSFDLIQSQIYDQQTTFGIHLPHKILPEVDICKNGHNYSISNLKLENTGIILDLGNDVRQLTEHKGSYLVTS